MLILFSYDSSQKTGTPICKILLGRVHKVRQKFVLRRTNKIYRKTTTVDMKQIQHNGYNFAKLTNIKEL